MITIQTIIKNNTPDMTGFFQSIAPLNAQIMAINMGATDECIKICKANKVEIYRPYGNNQSDIRNEVIKRGKYKYQMFIHPWETILCGWDQLKTINKRSYNVPIINENLLSKEGRIWNINTGIKFVNPIFEHLNEKTSEYCHCVLSSTHQYDTLERLEIINKWKKYNINSPDPYYYQSLCFLTLGRHAEFLKTSSHYMHLNKAKSVSSTMNKYYFAFVHTYTTKLFKPALQNITQCLEVNPLMAEFWCLIGDVYYYLLKQYDKAKIMYDNGIILGSRRKQNDIWPMDISKYEEYPQKMIKSCDAIISNKSYFIK